MTALVHRFLIILVIAFISLSSACTAELTTEQKQLVAELKGDLSRIRQEIADAQNDDARYSGGLIKALIAIRLEVLRTNAALVEQRIHTIEAGVRSTLVVNTTKPDPERAARLAKEIDAQKEKVAEARREAERYSGGLIQALSETSVATARNTLAMLEQQYVLAKYGLTLPTPASAGAEQPAAPAAAGIEKRAAQKAHAASGMGKEQNDCLKIESFDSSVLSTNDVFTELAWKVDVSNSCTEPFSVRVRFVVYDKDEFELDSGNETVYVPAHGVGKARGKMLVSPPGKARRMAKQGASISAR